jgi:hypothetical protein
MIKEGLMAKTPKTGCFRPFLEALEGRCLPSVTLFQDSFQTAANPLGGGWNDINHAIATRQSGPLAPIPYLESDVTASGGAFDDLTQVNNLAVPNTLRLATQPLAGQSFTFVTPAQNFGAFGLSVQHLQVAIDPLGPGSSSATDHWAAVVFGAAPGSFVAGTGTGVLVRDSGEYELWDRGNLVSFGQLGAKTNAKQFYTIDFFITTSTGQFTLSIDGKQIFTGNHDGAYTTNYVTLEDFTNSPDAGTQVDYFADLSITGTVHPLPLIAQPDTTYYVSPNGNDNNAGSSSATAWRTIAKVNHVYFRPGDQVLFQGGATFDGNLSFGTQDIGLARDPITIGSYGYGMATIAAGQGTGIAITNTSYFTIENLNVAGSGFLTNKSDGIRVTNDISGRAIFGFDIHDVDVSGFGHVGIDFVGLNGSADFAHISVTDSSAHDNGDGGVQVFAEDSNNASDVYIGHVQANHNAGSASTDSGYGILVFGATNVVIEYSVTGDNGWLPGNHGETGGIEAIADNFVLLQYNEAYQNHFGNSDGDGIILDVTNNSIMQYNYTHDNDGAGLFLLAETGFASTNNIIRYNISQNDARTQADTYGGIFVGSDVVNADIYNNTVFMAPSPNSSPSAIRLLGLLGNSIHVRNNIFVTTGGVPLVNWDGSGTDVLFQGNDYFADRSPFVISWNGVNYQSLAAWRAATGEEMLDGKAVGFEVDPRLKHPGQGGTIGNADLLHALTAYKLHRNSLVAHAGLDLRSFGLTWDPYHYVDDPFLDQFFSQGPRDFYGHRLPGGLAGPLSIGADQPRA